MEFERRDKFSLRPHEMLPRPGNPISTDLARSFESIYRIYNVGISPDVRQYHLVVAMEISKSFRLPKWSIYAAATVAVATAGIMATSVGRRLMSTWLGFKDIPMPSGAKRIRPLYGVEEYNVRAYELDIVRCSQTLKISLPTAFFRKQFWPYFFSRCTCLMLSAFLEGKMPYNHLYNLFLV
jgi:hypothetical protein